MKEHICEESSSCSCLGFNLEPAEDCPVHGNKPWPPRCCICGRYMRRRVPLHSFETCLVKGD